MLKKLGLPAVALGTALSLLGPTALLARDHDRDRDARHEFRERREFRRGPRFSFYYGPSYTYGYNNGYYDQFGNWHPYGYGWYDRWGRFHPY